MTATDNSLLATPRHPGIFSLIRLAVRRRHRRHVHRQALLHLSGYDAHMLRDMGIDPRDIETALNQGSFSVLLHPMRPEGMDVPKVVVGMLDAVSSVVTRLRTMRRR